MKHLLVTGGAGFVGANFVRFVLAETDWAVTVLDALTYAGNLENLAGLGETFAGRYAFVHGDVAQRGEVEAVMRGEAGGLGRPEAVVHLAAESHVDRAIQDASAFLRTNVLGTQVVLDAARALGVGRVLHVGTDEVYGSLDAQAPPSTESSPLAPNSAYAASKAAADLLCRAAFRTHGQDVVVTRSSNNYGPYQFPEKLIPLMTVRALREERLPVYGDGRQVRDWLHVSDHCRALLAVLRRGRAGEVYNVGGTRHAGEGGDAGEWTNLDVVRQILAELDKPAELVEHVADRPGHDRRYAIAWDKAEAELGWSPTVPFSQGLATTVAWYRDNETWWQRVFDGRYRDWIRTNYERRGSSEEEKSG